MFYIIICGDSYMQEYFEAKVRDSGSGAKILTIPKAVADMKQIKLGETIKVSIQKKIEVLENDLPLQEPGQVSD